MTHYQELQLTRYPFESEQIAWKEPSKAGPVMADTRAHTHISLLGNPPRQNSKTAGPTESKTLDPRR